VQAGVAFASASPVVAVLKLWDAPPSNKITLSACSPRKHCQTWLTEWAERLPAVPGVAGSTFGPIPLHLHFLHVDFFSGRRGKEPPPEESRANVAVDFLVSHVLRSSVCVCRVANGGDDDSASFIQLLLASAVVQLCQNRLRSCDYGAGTGCNRSKASENPKNSLHAPPPCVCCAANGGDDGFALFVQVLLACADFQFCPNRLRGCDSRAGTGRNRSRASINPRLAFAPLPRACAHTSSPIYGHY